MDYRREVFKDYLIEIIEYKKGEVSMKLKRIHIIKTFIALVIFYLLSSSQTVFAAQTKSYDISKGNVTIEKSGNYTITGKTSANTITIKKGVSANITVQNIDISISDSNKYPILVESGGSANFILKGENKITNRFDDGISVKSGGKFIVSSYSTGSLEVSGGLESSGIGGSGAIIINGGKIKAFGGIYGYGIGSGSAYQYFASYKDEAGSITITGGNVTAIGGAEAAGGIGYSSDKKIGTVTITGGTVYATSGNAGIGDHSFDGKGNKITISGGHVTAIGNAYGVGIGNGLTSTGTTVTISGGTVKAVGCIGITMYDTWSYGNDSRLWKPAQANDISAEKIKITGGQIFADNCSVRPVNAEGQNLYPMLIQTEVEKVTKISVYQKNYGSKDISSNGILGLWLPNLQGDKTFLEVTFASGKKTTKDACNTRNVLQDFSQMTDIVFDVSISNLDVYADGIIYNNKMYKRYGEVPIKITGSTSKNQIIVHSGKHRFELENVSVDYRNQTNQMFFIVGGESDVLINYQKQNTIKTGGKSVGFFVGNSANLSFTSTSNENKLILESHDDSYGLATGRGSIKQLGGSISLLAKDKSIGMYLGNEGSFSLYNGKIDGVSSLQSVIYGLNFMRVNVHGGTMNIDNIGYKEEGNEEVPDYSRFTITNGEVRVSNRMIFSRFDITGGTINAHLLGSGSGTSIYMYQGKLVMDKFITNYYEVFEEGSKANTWREDLKSGGASTLSALQSAVIYGGEVKETNNVTVEEMNKIMFGRS